MRTSPLNFLLSLTLPLLTAGCSGSTQNPTPDLAQAVDAAPADQGAELALDLPPVVDLAPAPDSPAQQPILAVIWRGVGYSWQKTPHRLNKLGALVSSKGLDSKSMLVSTTAIIEGGSFATGQQGTDTADYEVGFTAVRTTAARFVEGSFAPLTVKGNATKLPETVAQTQQEQRISLTKAGLASAKQLVLLLRGFSVDTDLTHKDGYTTRGLTIKLSTPARQGDELVTTLTARVHAGVVSDRVQKLGNYGATVKVHYTLVAVDQGAAASKAVAYQLDLAGGVNPKHAPADKTKAAVTLAGKPGMDAGLVGLQGFELWINRTKTIFPGRYLRAVRVSNDQQAHSKAAGTLSCQAQGFFSNSGLLTYATTVEYKAQLVLLQLAQGAVERRKVTGAAKKTSTTDTTVVTF